MIWIAHLDTVATILMSAAVASLCVSAMFFSALFRRGIYRKRSRPLPVAKSRIDSIALAGMDDLHDRSIRLRPAIILRNPFEARTREELAGGPVQRALRRESGRPTFRRSTVLQQRIAESKRALASFAALRFSVDVFHQSVRRSDEKNDISCRAAGLP